jgi:predicted nucleic acid-binding protein
LRVVYDACVLFPMALRDVLIELATMQLFEAHWSDEIHQEWTRNLRLEHPDISQIQLERTKKLMNQAVLNSLVTDYEDLIPQLELPDPNDRHVLAVAIRCKADFIITTNLRDFPNAALNKYGIQAVHPDQFILDLLSSNTNQVIQAVYNCQERFRNPPRSLEIYFERLEKTDLKQSVTHLKKYLL